MDMQTLEVLRSISLLYVEDDAATREELAMILEPWLGKLHVASDGQAGLALFSQKLPDIVVTDIQMPKINGLEMSGKIRELVPGQPIVVVSAYNDVEYLFKAIELGIDQYVTKPVNVELLLKKLAAIATGILAVRERERNQTLLAQYKMLVDQAANVSKFTPDGRITYVNDKLCEIRGYAPEDLLGHDISELNHASEPPDNGKVTLAQLRCGKRWTGIVRKRMRTGELLVVESSLVPILDEHGAVTEVVSLDVDLTEHHRLYQNLVETLSTSNRSFVEQRHFFAEYKRALELGSCICVTDLPASDHQHEPAVRGPDWLQCWRAQRQACQRDHARCDSRSLPGPGATGQQRTLCQPVQPLFRQRRPGTPLQRGICGRA